MNDPEPGIPMDGDDTPRYRAKHSIQASSVSLPLPRAHSHERDEWTASIFHSAKSAILSTTAVQVQQRRGNVFHLSTFNTWAGNAAVIGGF